jgi:hypothetical protein
MFLEAHILIVFFGVLGGKNPSFSNDIVSATIEGRKVFVNQPDRTFLKRTATFAFRIAVVLTRDFLM